MSSKALMQIQTGLKEFGLSPGPIDGIWGKKTEAAVRALLNQAGNPVLADAVTDLPWMAEAKKVLGRHEARDNGFLSKWLKSDGKTLGDPAKLPWCGDFVETCLRLALPGEVFSGALKDNPYWALNWAGLGDEIAPTYGAVVVFGRNGGGHVGFLVGQDDDNFHVLGGNQKNTVCIARLAKKRKVAVRWPSTFPRPITPRLPRLKPDGEPSTDEA